jgi:hypothetical protein
MAPIFKNLFFPYPAAIFFAALKQRFSTPAQPAKDAVRSRLCTDCPQLLNRKNTVYCA